VDGYGVNAMRGLDDVTARCLDDDRLHGR
jgi:hypothetical protein